MLFAESYLCIWPALPFQINGVDEFLHGKGTDFGVVAQFGVVCQILEGAAACCAFVVASFNASLTGQVAIGTLQDLGGYLVAYGALSLLFNLPFHICPSSLFTSFLRLTHHSVHINLPYFTHFEGNGDSQSWHRYFETPPRQCVVISTRD